MCTPCGKRQSDDDDDYRFINVCLCVRVCLCVCVCVVFVMCNKLRSRAFWLFDARNVCWFWLPSIRVAFTAAQFQVCTRACRHMCPLSHCAVQRYSSAIGRMQCFAQIEHRRAHRIICQRHHRHFAIRIRMQPAKHDHSTTNTTQQQQQQYPAQYAAQLFRIINEARALAPVCRVPHIM